MKDKKALSARHRSIRWIRTRRGQKIAGACFLVFSCLYMQRTVHHRLFQGNWGPYVMPAGATSQHGLDWYWAMASQYAPWNPETRRFAPPRWCRRDRTWIDVGTHMRTITPGWTRGASYTQGKLTDANKVPPAVDSDWFGNTVIFAFEPQLRFWHALKGQATGPQSCLFLIPAGAGPKSGPSSFSVTKNLHSSSFFSSDADAISRVDQQMEDGGNAFALKNELRVVEKTDVMVVSLSDLIPRIGSCRVELLKVDAQGFDLEVIKSAGEWLKVVDIVMVETPGPDGEPLYEGAPTKDDVVAYMASMGFVERASSVSCCGTDMTELNVYFENIDRGEAIGDECPGAGCKLGRMDECTTNW